MSAPSLTLLPPGWTCFYEWDGADGVRRETYTLLGFALDEPEGKREAADLHRAAFLLVLRTDGQATFLTMGRMTLVPPLPAASPSTEPREQQIERIAAALRAAEEWHASRGPGGSRKVAAIASRLYDAGLRASTEPPRP